MPRLFDSRREMFAQCIAQGLAPRMAALQCGYVKNTRARVRQRLQSPDIIMRVSELHAEDARAMTDITPIMDRMLGAANAASQLKTAAGYNAARALLAEAARLTAKITVPPRPKIMSQEEWLKANAIDVGEPGWGASGGMGLF